MKLFLSLVLLVLSIPFIGLGFIARCVMDSFLHGYTIIGDSFTEWISRRY